MTTEYPQTFLPSQRPPAYKWFHLRIPQCHLLLYRCRAWCNNALYKLTLTPTANGSYSITMESGTNTSYITTNQPNNKSNPNAEPTTKQHAVVSIQVIITCSTYPETSYKAMLLCFHCQCLVPTAQWISQDTECNLERMAGQMRPHMKQLRRVFKQYFAKHTICHADSTVQKQRPFNRTHFQFLL